MSPLYAFANRTAHGTCAFATRVHNGHVSNPVPRLGNQVKNLTKPSLSVPQTSVLPNSSLTLSTMSIRKRPDSSKKSNERGILSRVSSIVAQSPIIYRSKRAAFVAKKLLKSTGKAAWIAGTTFLILVVPLIIEIEREQLLNELELQQASLLGTPPVFAAPK
ncbi:unnamed protein product [Ilex paraguariensis]|uniref:Uncharacterized protein n=1 Tax=Ilex paraguariensis TaxID=185542 RepID=A0ABC8SYB0_9AQUA